ncbi:MAG: hypothetical protein JKY19_11905 [Alcanivoracaceae bacterium]|nr:hypothetical protein [Alcanivoracaceae bacterium]
MRIIILIFFFTSLKAIAQESPKSLKNLIKIVKESTNKPMTPPICPGKLLSYVAKITYLYEGRTLKRRIILEIPDDFLEQKIFCGYYDQDNYNWRIHGEVLNSSLVMYLLKHVDHARQTLKFKTKNSGIYIDEIYGWRPYKKYEGTFTLEKLTP